MLKHLDHLGILVKDLDKIQRAYSDAFGLSASKVEQLQSARVAFLPIGETNLELLEPVAKEGPLASFLEKNGEGLHHICFIVDDIDYVVEELIRKGIKMRDKTPRTGSRGTKIAFTEPDQFGGVLIEFCQFLRP